MAPEESSIAANGVDAKERGDYHHYYTGGAYQAPLVVPSGMAWTRVQDYRMPDASGVGAGAVWMLGGGACAAQAHRRPFLFSTR